MELGPTEKVQKDRVPRCKVHDCRFRVEGVGLRIIRRTI